MADFLRFSVPGKPEYVGTVRLAVSSVASTAGFDVEEIEDIKVAVSEVCTSVFCKTRKSISYQVNCELGENGIIISICDEDSGICDETTAIPVLHETSGFSMGLLLVKALMDEVDIFTPDEKNTLIRMIKYYG